MADSRDSAPALATLARKRKLLHCARLALVVTACVIRSSRGEGLHRNLRSLGASLRRQLLLEVLASSPSPGLAPREGLVLLVLKMGRTRPSMEPRRGPQASKSGYPGSQNADSSPRAQGMLGLGFEAKPKGKCGVLWALTACGLGRRVVIDGTWASPLPHAASATLRLDGTMRHA